MITFIRLQSDLFYRLELTLLQSLDLLPEYLIRRRCRVYTARLNGDDNMTPIFEEALGIVDDYPGLVGLCYVCEDDIYR